MVVPTGHSHAIRGRHPRGSLSLAVDRSVLRARARAQGGRAVNAGRREGPPDLGGRGSRPGDVPRAEEAVPTGKGPVPRGRAPHPIGKAALRRDGDDLTIIAYGSMSHFAVEAADRLAEEGIEVTVIDLRTLRPLDWPTIEAAVERTSKVLIVHEDTGSWDTAPRWPPRSRRSRSNGSTPRFSDTRVPRYRHSRMRPRSRTW